MKISLLIAAVLALGACASAPVQQAQPQGNTISVVVSNQQLYEASVRINGQRVGMVSGFGKETFTGQSYNGCYVVYLFIRQSSKGITSNRLCTTSRVRYLVAELADNQFWLNSQ